jgi:hypothetical protein
MDARRKRSDGVRTMDDLRVRCVIDGAKDCWVWGGAAVKSSTGRGSLSARVWLPEPPGGGGPRTMTAALAAWLLSGRKLAPGDVVWRARCDCQLLCINPQHGATGTRQQMQAAFAADGRLRGDPRRAVVNMRNRAKWITPVAVVRDAERLFALGSTQQAVQEALGIGAAAARRIRMGVHPHCSERVQVVRCASVFTMGAMT